MKTMRVGLILLLLLALAGTVAASAVPYRLDWYVLTGGGGGHLSSSHYGLDFTVGQTAVGAVSSANYRVGLGYWPGVIVGAPPGAAIKLFLPVILRRYSTGF